MAIAAPAACTSMGAEGESHGASCLTGRRKKARGLVPDLQSFCGSLLLLRLRQRLPGIDSKQLPIADVSSKRKAIEGSDVTMLYGLRATNVRRGLVAGEEDESLAPPHMPVGGLLPSFC